MWNPAMRCGTRPKCFVLLMIACLAFGGCGMFTDIELPAGIAQVVKNPGSFDQSSNPLREAQPGTVHDSLRERLTGCWGTYVQFVNLPQSLSGSGFVEALLIDVQQGTFARQQMYTGSLLPTFVVISAGDVEIRSDSELLLVTRSVQTVGVRDLESTEPVLPEPVEVQVIATLEGDALLLKWPDDADISDRATYRRFDCPGDESN